MYDAYKANYLYIKYLLVYTFKFIFQFYQLVNRNRRNPKTLREGMKTQIKKTPKAVVNIYDASSLFFIHRELGEKYM